MIKVYELSPTPCLYVAPAEIMVGRVPLIPLFLGGNTTPTIPHKYSKLKNSGFPSGCADEAAENGRHSSKVYEVNTWLWQFGRGKPRLGGLTVGETASRKLHTKNRPTVWVTLVCVARVILPDWNLELKCECDLHVHVPVHPMYRRVCTCMYNFYIKFVRRLSL